MSFRATTHSVSGIHKNLHLVKSTVQFRKHGLTGCREFKNNYSARHNTLVENIAPELPHVMAVDKTIGSTFKELGLSSSEHPKLNLKPDIVLRHENEVTIIDVASPYDLYIENFYQAKLNKYYCIRDLFQQNGLKCAIDAIIIGSLGTVYKKTLNVLFKAGMNKQQANGVVKWCSASCIRGLEKFTVEQGWCRMQRGIHFFQCKR